MSKKTKASSLTRATPTIRKSKGSDVAKVTVTRSTTTAMKGSSLWSGSPTLQAANTAWNTAADAIEKNAKSITDLRSQLAVLEAAQVGLRHDWLASTKHMVAVAAVVAQGMPDQVAALGFDVLNHGAIGPQPAPAGLTAAIGPASGEVRFAWHRGTALHGFIVQHASDVANQATYSVQIPCTKSKYALVGAPSQSVVHFRVAAIDPLSSSGLSPWTDWVIGTVK
jgi:hypothetical protein